MTAHAELQRVIRDLKELGATVPTFSVDDLSDASAELWLRSERRRLEHLARAMGDQHA